MLHELFKANRTCRTFDESRRITTDELRSMVELARISPASANIQPLCYRLVNTPEETGLVQPLTKWAGALPELNLPPEGHRPTAFIVICQDTNKFGAVGKFDRDVGICALAISLAAAEMGLASCMIGSFNKEMLPKALGMPENLEALLVIAIGKADEQRELAPLRSSSTSSSSTSSSSTKYYRENGVHYVPKRELDDIII